ncbi:MAG: hypothetical protein QW379_10065 [Thermoplasmata archaeon]
MAKYLLTLTSDEFLDASEFVDWLSKHELAEPPLHGKDLFYTKSNKPVKKGDTVVWIYKRSRDRDIYLAGYAPVRSSVQGTFFSLPGPDGKRRIYHSVVSIDPKGKVVKKLRLSRKTFQEALKESLMKHHPGRSIEHFLRSGVYISEKEFRRLKKLLK